MLGFRVTGLLKRRDPGRKGSSRVFRVNGKATARAAI